MLKALTSDQLLSWMSSADLTYDAAKLSCDFSDSRDDDTQELLFRVPIGDYLLQLDYRIRQVLALLPNDDNILLFRKSLHWNFNPNVSVPPGQSPLHCTLRTFIPAPSAAACTIVDRTSLFVAAYLTNRWGDSSDSFYIVPQTRPQLMIYIPGSPESLFVQTKSLDLHDHCVKTLANQQIPAYGPYIPNPLPHPIYQDIDVGTGKVNVDPTTGKPQGPGSPESVLFPEFLPPA